MASSDDVRARLLEMQQIFEEKNVHVNGVYRGGYDYYKKMKLNDLEHWAEVKLDELEKLPSHKLRNYSGELYQQYLVMQMRIKYFD
jgi:hypothetical protein